MDAFNSGVERLRAIAHERSERSGTVAQRTHEQACDTHSTYRASRSARPLGAGPRAPARPTRRPPRRSPATGSAPPPAGPAGSPAQPAGSPARSATTRSETSRPCTPPTPPPPARAHRAVAARRGRSRAPPRTRAETRGRRARADSNPSTTTAPHASRCHATPRATPATPTATRTPATPAAHDRRPGPGHKHVRHRHPPAASRAGMPITPTAPERHQRERDQERHVLAAHGDHVVEPARAQLGRSATEPAGIAERDPGDERAGGRRHRRPPEVRERRPVDAVAAPHIPPRRPACAPPVARSSRWLPWVA